MEDVRICRICLVTDVKMYDLLTFPLDTYYIPVAGINSLNTIDLHPYACFECASLLKKYHYFREKCLLSQSFLCGILHTTGKITYRDIEQLDRQQLHLVSPLQPNTTPSNTFNLVYDESKQEIKDEPNDKDNDEHDYFNEYDDQILDSVSIKEEFDFPLVSTDDDEPLSLHKSNKEKVKKVEKKVKRGRKRKKEIEVKIDLSDVDLQEVQPTDLPELPELDLEAVLEPKKRRGRPRKTEAVATPRETVPKPRRTKNTGGVADEDIDLEEYVTIIKLTTADQMAEIAKRQHSSNYLNAPFQCQLCFKGFIDTHAWKHHVGKHDESAGEIECAVCKFRFKTKRTLQKHAANHEKKYACKSCPYVSKTTTQAKQHQRWHKGVTYKCQYCDEVSTKWTSYLSHVRIKHPSEFICGACGYSFVSKLGLTMHRTMMHKDVANKSEDDVRSKGPYCEQCDVKFISVEAYKRHMVTSVKHTESNDFTTGCRVCGETFPSAEELRVHHRKEHARKRPKNYGKKPANNTWPTTCEHCGESILNARDCWTHYRRAHPDKSYPIQKNYVCDICGKSFRGNAFLVYHKRTHFEERAYKCAQCPKAFFNRTNLQMHEKTHSDSRPYPCNVCFKAFKCKGALDRHYRSHTGVKPYECEVCGKAFGQSNSRKLHVRTVHLKQPAPYVSRSRLERRRHPLAEHSATPLY